MFVLLLPTKLQAMELSRMQQTNQWVTWRGKSINPLATIMAWKQFATCAFVSVMTPNVMPFFVVIFYFWATLTCD